MIPIRPPLVKDLFIKRFNFELSQKRRYIDRSFRAKHDYLLSYKLCSDYPAVFELYINGKLINEIAMTVTEINNTSDLPLNKGDQIRVQFRCVSYAHYKKYPRGFIELALASSTVADEGEETE